MSWTDDAKKTLGLTSSALHGLDTIGSMAKAVSGSKDISQLTGALMVITTVVDALKDAFASGKNPDDVEAEIKKLHDAIAANDQNAQSELDKKFPTG